MSCYTSQELCQRIKSCSKQDNNLIIIIIFITDFSSLHGKIIISQSNECMYCR